MATGVANRMKDHFGEAVDLKVHLINDPEASEYVLRGATTVFLDNEWVPLDIATSAGRMLEYLKQAMARKNGA